MALDAEIRWFSFKAKAFAALLGDCIRAVQALGAQAFMSLELRAPAAGGFFEISGKTQGTHAL